MKTFIQNRKGQKFCVLIEETPNAKGLAFVMHGLGVSKELPPMEVIAHTLSDNNYTVVRFDATNSYGESDGNYADATTTGYYQDLEDIINWSKNQAWYNEPFILAGHSLGALCCGLYSQKFPEKIKGLALFSSVVSGQLTYEATDPEELKKWRKTGWRISESVSRPGLIKKLKWSEMEDRLKYSLLTYIKKLTMPILMVAGETDTLTPVAHQQILFKELNTKKEMHVVKNAWHNFSQQQESEEIKDILNNWLNNL
jgi:pimeloyl-ACP methyl ester carboxylesterase